MFVGITDSSPKIFIEWIGKKLINAIPNIITPEVDPA